MPRSTDPPRSPKISLASLSGNKINYSEYRKKNKGNRKYYRHGDFYSGSSDTFRLDGSGIVPYGFDWSDRNNYGRVRPYSGFGHSDPLDESGIVPYGAKLSDQDSYDHGRRYYGCTRTNRLDETGIVPYGADWSERDSDGYEGHYSGFGYSDRLDETGIVLYDKEQGGSSGEPPPKPRGRSGADNITESPFDRRAFRRKELRGMIRRDKIHNQIDKATKDNVASDALHTYERYAEKPTIYLTHRASNKIYRRYKLFKDRLISKIEQNSSKVTAGIVWDAFKYVMPKNPAILIALAALLLIIIVFNLMSGGVITVLTSFVADEAEITGVTNYLQELDTNLIDEIEHIPDGYSNIDEVDLVFNGTISTNPTHVMAYLTVKYSDFTLNGVRSELDSIHNTLYTVTKWVETQIRTRTVTHTHTDPETGETSTDTEEEEYEYNILHITVTCRQFDDYVRGLLSGDDLEWYELLVETGGNMMLGGNLGNPFVGVDWRSFVTTPYGSRINPIDKTKEFHPAIDISWGGIDGTPINAVHDGVVVQAVYGDSVYGNYIMLEDAEQNLRTRYSHCSSLMVSIGQEVKRGDVIARVGSTGKSTGPHLDIEIYRNGKSVNPITELSFN